MKRVLVLVIIMLVILAIPPVTHSPTESTRNAILPQYGSEEMFSVSSASGSGDGRGAVVFASRQVSSFTLPIENSYSSTGVHSGSLDLSSYLIPGWSLYEVEIEVDSITAIAERETMGITPNTYITIINNTGMITDALYQEFYDQPHDGKLENYTITYLSTYYMASLGHAYLGVRSDYSDSQTNVTSWVTPFTQTLVDTDVTHDVSGDSAVLNASTSYYVVIDGTGMTGVYAGGWWFNTIYWSATSATLGLETGYNLRDDNWYIYQGIDRREALLNYTYTPWNQTSNSALVYSSPSQVSLQGNSSNLQGNSWTFIDPDNVTLINFNANQSVNLACNMTLWYKQSGTTTTDWTIPSSGADVEWSVETTIEYPEVTQANYLNISIPSTWDPDGLYNSTNPANNHTAFSTTGSMITCSQMYNETWTLELTSENRMKTLKTYTTVNDMEVVTKSLMTSDIDINSTIQEPDSDPVTSGTVHLEIWYSGEVFWSPSDKSVTNGLANYYWNISNPMTSNGEYTIETYWNNGTEAGYLSKSLVLYYPTSMVAESYNIDAYTESSFDISVNITDTFTPQGLNGSYASLVYSFDGAANQSLTDLNNGIWTATISTTGKAYGLYDVRVYATGYAIQNRSLQINASLIHDTESLTVQWSNTNDITYVESTELSVAYRRVGGTPISGATLNVTIDTTTWSLVWDGVSETYKKTFSGSDVPPGLGVHSLTVQAWKDGHKPQSDSTQTLTLQEEPTTLTLQWSNGNDITYVESTTLIANFTMNDGSPVLGALVNVTIGTDTWIMVWNGVTETYDYVFDGDADPPGLGVHSFTVEAGKFGYVYRSNSSLTLTLSEEPTSLVLTWSPDFDITYVEETYLIVNYTMSDGSVVVGATVNVTIGTDVWTLSWYAPTQTYRVLFKGSDSPPGLGPHPVTVQADLFGFDAKTDSTQTLTINEEPTSVTISWISTNDITFLESTVLSVRYEMSNDTPIPGAMVNVTINTDLWTLTWNPVSEAYEKTFLGSDDPPSFGTHTVTVRADLFGYQNQTDSTNQLIISEEPTNLVITWYNGNSITFVESTIIVANYTLTNGSRVLDALVNVTIGINTWTLIWNGVTETYEYTFYGDTVSPGIGIHAVSVEADKFGYDYKTDSSQTLTISEEPTTITLSWSPDNNITYVESTTLSARYDMSNGTAIPGATVNVTIGVDVWILIWNPVSEAYETTFSGADNPPGYGTHTIEIRASKYGYESILNSAQQLTIRLEETSISFVWNPSDTITYVEGTTIRISYLMSNGTSIQGATVNITHGPTRWDAVWNSTSQAYEWSWSGTDDPPGLGSHGLVIRAWKENYVGITDVSQTLTINEEPTLIQASWSHGNNITYVESTKLLINYTTSSGVVILGALVNVTIGTDVWILSWNATSQLYEKVFSGSDNPPDLGTHSLSIRGWQFGYEITIDGSQTLTLRIEPTTLTPSWFPSNSMTYVESTILSVRYETSSSNPISSALVNVTIGTDVWVLSWNPVSEAYEVTFEGSDNPPGLHTHALFIQASNFGYQYASDSLESLTITEEPTSFVISWSNGDNITYVKGTTLSVRYQMSNTSSIPGAVVNATIDGNTWTLTWNPISEAYERYFAGIDDPPGYGTHIVEIRASKFGYASIIDSTKQLTIRFEDTSVSFTWDPNNTITYVEGTKIRISYLMSNNTPILGATVNLTAGIGFWSASWNGTSQAYEISFSGSDDPPSLGTHLLTIKAWKVNYVGITDVSQTLTLNEEPTQIHSLWSDGNSITYVQSTTLLVSYTTSNGTVIPSALVNVTIGTDVWILSWNSTSLLYEYTFSGSDEPPGLGTHGLSIRGWKFGYELTLNNSATLTITGELGSISSTLLNGSTITYIEYTILAVNYTMSNGTAIPGAIVNVTIDATLWDLTWHAASETYRIQFNGSDSPLGLGTHNLIVKAWRAGFDGVTDSTQFLTIVEEPTTLTAYWGAPNFNSATYFDYTILYVDYQMSNGSDIVGASVNVTIDSTTWNLSWNSTAGAYSIRFNGDDSPPGFGTHSLLIEAALHGYVDGTNSGHSLTLSKDPTTIEVSWTNGNDITYIEYTVLSVVYKMSNGSDIPGAIVNATIGSDLWILTWNGTAGAYQVRFDGNQVPPGLGLFTIDIQASAPVFAAQSPSTSLILRTEGTTATPSWVSITFDWTKTSILSFDFRDSYGTLIDDATTKLVYIDEIEFTLQGTNGTYWIEFNNSYDLGLHNVWANFSKFGYDPATALSITFTIDKAQTDLTVVWSSIVIDYLSQADLTVDYYYVGTGTSVPSTGVVANITIDGANTVNLTLQGNLWVANLTGIFLDLGSHTVHIRAQSYGYEYSESLGIILTVNEVATDALAVTWTPSNLTIEYTDSFSLTVDYTFSGGDVPALSTVNVSIEGLFYDLNYSAGIWSVSIPGDELGIGIRTATISAWLYGYQHQTDVTVGLNVTIAANSFIATWEPLDLQATFIDTVNLSIIYTEDFVPILGATVKLSINGTLYTLTYSAVDEMWHFSVDASTIGIGVWNVTVTANKTGYADGWDSQLLTISLTPTNHTVIRSSTTIYYDESITLNIYYQMMNTSVVPGATCTVTMESSVQLTSWDIDHWVVTLDGTAMGLGIHSIVVNVDAFGFDPATNSFDVTVNAIPTSVTVNDVSFTVYPFDAVTVSFTWIDDLNAIGIAGYEPDVIWSDTYSIVDYGNGTYSIELGNNATHVGIYDLNVTFTRIGYAIGFRIVSVEIVQLPIVLTFNDRIEQFENETITISIQMYDGPHAALVDWGEIVIELSGVQYSLVYDNSSQAYTTDIWLSDLEPGFYILNFTATATDCEIEYGEIQLDIWPKIRYTIVLEVDDEVQAGQTVHMSILITYESGAVPGFSAIVHILIERDQSGTHEISERVIGTDGLAELDFLVPSDATRLTIWVDFNAAIGEWPAISNTIIRDVTPMDIISLLRNPTILAIVVGGGGGGALVGLILLRRRRRGRGVISSPSVVDSIMAPTSVSSAPVGEMDMMQENIRGNPDGLTRAQIAQSLEISTSKARALVKKLLDSDLRFEEVREGRLRRIRFKSDI